MQTEEMAVVEVRMSEGSTGRIGREIPPVQLVLSVQAELFTKALEWLKANGVPDEVRKAFDTAALLMAYAGYMDAGKMDANETEDLLMNLITAANLSVKFGGDFFGWNTGDSQIPDWKRPIDSDQD